MKRAAIFWSKSSSVVRPIADNGFPASAVPLERPRSMIPLRPRDEAIFLLHTAAEVEHSLLIQYLYAAYSMGDVSKRADVPAALKPIYTGWQAKIRRIAIEEMAHLLTVQNVLLSIGGPLNFEREDYPFRSDFYPFPFSLRPLGKDVLARFIAAEMPEFSKVSAAEQHEVLGIVRRATVANEDMAINRVGPLYDQIIDLIEQLDPARDFVFSTAATFQGQPSEWGATPNQTTGRIIWLINSQADAVDSLRAVQQQGEAPANSNSADSHFHRFLDIYRDDQFPETNPRYGPVGANFPALPVAVNPNTLPRRMRSRAAERGRITDRCTRLWAHLLNLRYRMLLYSLEHHLRLPYVAPDSSGVTPPNCRTRVLGWTFTMMKLRIPRLAKVLAAKSRKHPNVYIRGRAATAGAPFELPYSLIVAQGAVEPWLAHRDMAHASRDIIERLRDCASDPNEISLLDDLSLDDDEIATVANSQIQIADGECQPRP